MIVVTFLCVPVIKDEFSYERAVKTLTSKCVCLFKCVCVCVCVCVCCSLHVNAAMIPGLKRRPIFACHL